MTEEFNIESASRDELVAFYNANKDEEAEALSVASSKDTAKAAVEALLAAEADQSVEAAALEEAAANLDEAIETVQETIEEPAAESADLEDSPPADQGETAEDGTVAGPADPDAEPEADENPAEDDETDYSATEELTADESEDDAEEEVEFCEMCGNLGLIPRCPSCATERREV